MSFWQKILNLPESKRRIIFWIVIVFITIILFFLFVLIAKEQLSKIKNSGIERSLEIPNVKEKIEDEVKPQIESKLNDLEQLGKMLEAEKNSLSETTDLPSPTP